MGPWGVTGTPFATICMDLWRAETQALRHKTGVVFGNKAWVVLGTSHVLWWETTPVLRCETRSGLCWNTRHFLDARHVLCWDARMSCAETQDMCYVEAQDMCCVEKQQLCLVWIAYLPLARLIGSCFFVVCECVCFRKRFWGPGRASKVSWRAWLRSPSMSPWVGTGTPFTPICMSSGHLLCPSCLILKQIGPTYIHFVF